MIIGGDSRNRTAWRHQLLYHYWAGSKQQASSYIFNTFFDEMSRGGSRFPSLCWNCVMMFAAISLFIVKRPLVSGFVKGANVAGTNSKPARRSFSHRRAGDPIVDETRLVKDMLERIRMINRIPDQIRASVLDFSVDGVKLGKVGPIPNSALLD